MKICKTCPLYNNGFCSTKKAGKCEADFVYNGQRRYKDKYYFGCGCPLKQKTRSLDSQCPLNKWPKKD